MENTLGSAQKEYWADSDRMMTPIELLELFSRYSDEEICSLRRTPVLDQFSNESATYTQIAKSFFAGCNYDWESRQRLVSILREFLYHDGRSFEALLWIVERAFAESEYFDNGINSLASLWCYLNLDQPAPISDEELLGRFRKYAANSELRQNAENCCSLILRKRPDLSEK
jgi:hypothetical protein